MRPDPAILFHAGFHKTGTSSLQTALRLHTPAIAPHFAVETRATSPALMTAAQAARDYSANPTPQTTARLAQRLHAWAKSLNLHPARGLLVSCEDFAGHIPGRLGVPDYRATLPIAAAIRVALTSPPTRPPAQLSVYHPRPRRPGCRKPMVRSAPRFLLATPCAKSTG